LHTNNIKTAANCYNKAAILESETLYSLTRQAFTLTLLNRYTEAIALFDKVISQSPKYLLARKGKGEAYFYLAIQQLGRYKDQLAVSHIQQSLTVKFSFSNKSNSFFSSHFMMLYVYNRIMHAYGRNTVMHACSYILFMTISYAYVYRR